MSDTSRLPYVGADGYRYVPITFRLKGPTVQDLVPYMMAATYMVLSLLVIQWPWKRWSYRTTDVIVWSCCYALHHFKQPLLSHHLALAYTVWNLYPGSLTSKKLPGHKQFMRDLKTTKASETSSECTICWSDDCDLAKISCGHPFCKPCLQQMGEGERFQTTCPMCRKPLFSVHSRLMLATTKGTYVCMATTVSKNLMDMSFELMQRKYWWALFNLGLLGTMLAFPVYAALKLRAAGMSLVVTQEPMRSRSVIRTSCVAFLCSATMASWNAWGDYARFK